MMLRIAPSTALLLTVLFYQPSLAADTLPEPLTLEYALELATRSDHPDLLKVQAHMADADADLGLVDTENDVQASVSGGLRLIEPSDVAYDQRNNDSYLQLNISKRLYDFGRTEAAEQAADAAIKGGKYRLLDVRQNRYLDVMQRFFDVMLADLRNAKESEAMAVAFVRLDKARARVEMKQLSDLELLALEQDYQQARIDRERQCPAGRTRQVGAGPESTGPVVFRTSSRKIDRNAAALARAGKT